MGLIPAQTMRLARLDNDRLVFESRTPVRGGLGVGALFLVAALLPFFGEELTLPHWLTFAVLAAIGGGLIGVSWPRRKRLVLQLRERRLEGAGNPIALDDIQGLELGGTTENPDEVPTIRYEVRLRARAGRELVLLSAKDPAAVSRDLGRLLEVCPLPVRTGWGLPKGATPWRAAEVAADAERPSAVPREIVLEPHDPPLPGGITVLIGGVGVGLMWGIDIYRRAQTGLPLSALSIALAVFFSLLLSAVGLMLVSSRLVLRTGPSGLILEARTLGLRRERFRVPPETLGRVHAVSPDGEDAWHLLLETTLGAFSVPCRPSSASELLQELRRTN
ncbi:MAG: hypothetical protein R3B89_33650 [Polyangiaceae bacterium]